MPAGVPYGAVLYHVVGGGGACNWSIGTADMIWWSYNTLIDNMKPFRCWYIGPTLPVDQGIIKPPFDFPTFLK